LTSMEWEKKYYGSQWSPSTVLATHILQNIVCVQQKKETHPGSEQLETECTITKCSFLGELSL